MTRVTVIGAGAIGGTIGALLARGGEQVELIEADAAHVRAIEADGLTIDGPDGPFTVRVPATGWDGVRDVGDVVLIAVKAHFTEDVLDRLEPLLGDDAVVVTLQNGLACLQIAERLGRDRTLAALVNLFADYEAPGRIKYYYPGEFVIGELAGAPTGRLDELVELFAHWGPVEISPNVEGLLWTKLGNASMLSATALVDTTIHEAVDREREVMVALAAETYDVALAEGVELERLPYFDPMALVRAARADPVDVSCLDGYVDEFRAHAKPRSGIWRDIVVRKRKTEVGAHLGFLIERARHHAIPTPLTEKVLALISDLEDGRRAMGWENLDELRAVAA